MTYTATRRSAHAGYVVQAVVNTLAPLLFVVFHTRLDVPVAQLGALAGLNFAVQLLTDLAAVRVVDRIGYRRPLVAAHAFAAVGLVLLAVLPLVTPSPFVGLCIAVVVYGVGGGLLEVLVSPVVEHLPQPEEAKAAGMALAHSFYCWGQLGVVVVTTGLLAVVGTRLWPVLPVLWALVPLANLVVLLRVPLPPTVPDEHRTSLRSLFGTPLFLAALVLMATGGAAELTLAQWASFFAEEGTGISKEAGDLLGLGMFAFLQGAGRVAYGLWGQRLPLRPLLAASGVAAAACYVVAATASAPALSLAACALCGLAVALMWPGTFSLTSARFPLGGAAMFAVLALAGDGGATVGPLAAGVLADLTHGPLAGLAAALPDDSGTGLRAGLLLSAVVPAAFAVTVLVSGRARAALPREQTVSA
ncbi:MFS transporter [Cellulomonas shaoxiangyii]|uniref:MFS transporter n=1 Tax=Cellulomonas shaoxiangyii TaxID=2566013 RepID=A0A4P7SPY7_9CELL|nr:MFS transporter [Cellulomonas shaoxiangyii]TGY84541.1 MFS transporter [Cellulomonas shaoxiangyii]